MNSPTRVLTWRDVPGPHGWPLLGSLPTMARDLLGFWKDMVAKYGDIARYSTGAEWSFLISHPELINYILQQDTVHYYKGKYSQILQSVVGNGLLISNGDLWQRQRRLLQPAFAKSQVVAWMDIVTTTVDSLLDAWDARVDSSQTLDMAGEMTFLVQEITAKLLFGRAIQYHPTATLLTAMSTISHNLLRQILQEMVLGGLLNRLPLPSTRRYQGAVADLHATVTTLIDAGRRRPEPDTGTILSLLQKACDEATDAHLDDHQLRDELITLFTAGHETTASALAWTFYYLTENPEWAERIHTEVAQVITRGSPTFDQLAQLTCTRQVIEESMRLMPPVYGLGRRLKVDDEIGGYRIPAESMVIMSQYVMHRHPRYWEFPERFDPDRFSPEGSRSRPRYAYFPFGGGPRSCIGRHLAMMEMLTIVAMILHRFVLNRVPGRRVVPHKAITLRPRYGVLVTVHRR